MQLTPQRVSAEHEWVRGRAEHTVGLINRVRGDLGEVFGADVDHVSAADYLDEVDAVFDSGDLAVNVAAIVAILRELDVDGDYPGFVVDEYLGRRLAGIIAAGDPLTLLAEATFHYADLLSHGSPDEAAGVDDLDAALAAGFQTRLPGWRWREGPNPFDGSEREGAL